MYMFYYFQILLQRRKTHPTLRKINLDPISRKKWIQLQEKTNLEPISRKTGSEPTLENSWD